MSISIVLICVWMEEKTHFIKNMRVTAGIMRQSIVLLTFLFRASICSWLKCLRVGKRA